MPDKKLLILANFSKPGVAEVVEALRPWFEARAEVLRVLAIGDRPGDEADQADLCVIFGGDGTLLTAARLLAESNTPLLGVNMGKLGFLAEFNVEHMRKHFDEILRGEVRPTERLMLEVRVAHCEEGSFEARAANDVAISAGPPFRMIDLKVDHGDSHVAQYLGDGLVVATPSGSTGYSLSAGGPILEPTLDAVVITPVAPHTLSMRPIVVSSAEVIRVTALRVNPGTSVIVDGQVTSGLEDGQVVEVRRSPHPARIIPHPGRPFFDTLTRKLQWGKSPHHKS